MLANPSTNLTAIIKPTHECNLGCLYCYEGGRPQLEPRMNDATLHNILSNLVSYSGSLNRVRIIWHGGEPLLMGLDFFEKVLRLESEIGPGVEFDNSIQTNATLLNDELLDFFIEHNFSIGASLDGPEWLHNFTRPYADGRPSFNDALQSINRTKDLIQAHNPYLGGGVIAVLTKPVLAHLDDFYEFFRDNQINVKINPIFYAGNAAGVRGQLGITPREYGEAMVYLFDRWFNESEYRINISPFDLVLGNLLTGKPRGCQFGPACFDEFIAVNPNGDVYPCGRWSNHGFKMGNLNEESLSAIRLSPVLERFREARMQAIASCAPCDFRTVCNSGCVENSYLTRQQLSDRDLYCAGYKHMFGHLRQALIQEFDRVGSYASVQNEQSIYLNIVGRSVNLETLTHPTLIKILKQRGLGKSHDTSSNGDLQWIAPFQTDMSLSNGTETVVESKSGNRRLSLGNSRSMDYGDYSRHSDYSDWGQSHSNCP